MKITDFGKNVYQCEVFFKADIVPDESVRYLVEQLFSTRGFTELAKDAATGESQITKGKGTQGDPFEQVKLGRDRFTIWVGWHYPHEKWIHTRQQLAFDILDLLHNPRPSFVKSVMTQARITVPFGKVKELDEIAELQPLAGLYRTFVPQEFFDRLAQHNIFTDGTGSKSIEWQYFDNDSQAESVFAFGARLLVPREDVPFKEQLTQNFALCDTVLAKFHSSIVVPSVRS